MSEQLTVYEASRALKISVDAVYRLCQSGKLLAYKRRARWAIPRTAINDRIKLKSERNGAK
jgi:excisionase family DNA binding protein